MSEAELRTRPGADIRLPQPVSKWASVQPAWLGAWAAILAYAIWLSRLTPIWLGVVVLGSAIWTVGVARGRDNFRLAAALLLWVAAGVGAGVQLRLTRIVQDWPSLQYRVEESSAAALGDALDGLLASGEQAVAVASDAAELYSGSRADPELFARLERLERTSGVSAIALFDPQGTAVAWAGEHRGSVPDRARRGTQSYLFEEGPLFSYAYFIRPLPSGLTATAAFLLEASVDVGEGIVPFAEQFERQHGARPQFWPPDRARPEAVWDWATDEEGPILSVSFAALTQQHWWERARDRGRQTAAAIGLAALLALAAAWYRTNRRDSGLPVVVTTAALLFAPLGQITGADTLFSPLQFSLPGPLVVTLGVLLVVEIGAALWLLTRGGVPRRLMPIWLWLPLAAAILPLALMLVDRSVIEGLMASLPSAGFPVLLATALLIAVPLFLVLKHGRPWQASPEQALIARWVGYSLPALLGLGLLLWWRPGGPIPWAVAAAWAFATPLLLVRPYRSNALRGSLRNWLIAGWLSSTVALSFLWPMHVRAELWRAERQVGSLGTQPDTFLDYLLRQYGEQVTRFASEGESGVNLLYHGWIESGLAREGYEARMSLWRNGIRERELNLSELDSLSPRTVADATAAIEAPIVIHYGGVDGLHYLLAFPLGDSLNVSVAVPPRRRIGAETSLGQLLHPGQTAGGAEPSETLYLVQVDPDQTAGSTPTEVTSDTVHWLRQADGWRSETLVQMPEGLVHAHLVVASPGYPLLLTRATLLVAGLLVTMFLIWLAAQTIRREPSAMSAFAARWLRSFRGRLSVALFFFFLLPTLVFGAVSYRAVAGEVLRSAAAMAQQALDQAATRLPAPSLRTVGSQVQTDLLLYREGTLVDATAPEVLELGLFHTWLTPSVYLRFTGGEEVQELEERRLADSDYLVAYQRIDQSSVLAAPIPLASNEITRRQREFRDAALLVILLGLALSVVLALLVSRELASPLDELSRAALTVGSGDLRTRLPEIRSDEFGSVYHSFNQMVGRLDRTRAALVQETRRTETIVAEAATGVLALNAQGRVELINPRAAEILGGTVGTGDTLVASDEADDPLAAAVSELLDSRAPEASKELELNGRTIRLKLRRLTGEEGGGGAVIALEDVTAELRTARVLAWGEMARQVAHEIKNPLTPIKLAVQHLRRASIDRRPDFDQILDRNVESILSEIDRLGEISRAFSRFGTPAAVSSPLEDVDVPVAVDEVLTLYHGSEGGATFRSEMASRALPRAIARTGELKEVLLNLLENARDAIAADGEVVVSVVEDEAPGWIRIVVQDNGIGISEEQLPSIFEPHFSTRSSGTGLGLAIVRRIVDSWGGEIRAESKLGEGTKFTIRLRVSQ